MPHHQQTSGSDLFSRRALLLGGAGASISGGLLLFKRTFAGEHVELHASPSASPQASPGATPVSAATIHMTKELRFDPPEVTIKAGDTITWDNDSPMPHTATGDPEQNPVSSTYPDYVQLPKGAEPWGSELLQPGESYSHAFDVPGTYSYICIPHVLGGMRGKIKVEK